MPILYQCTVCGRKSEALDPCSQECRGKGAQSLPTHVSEEDYEKHKIERRRTTLVFGAVFIILVGSALFFGLDF